MWNALENRSVSPILGLSRAEATDCSEHAGGGPRSISLAPGGLQSAEASGIKALCPDASATGPRKTRVISDPLTMYKSDLGPFMGLGAEEEQRLGRAVSEGRSAMIAVFGEIPLCGRLAAEPSTASVGQPPLPGAGERIERTLRSDCTATVLFRLVRVLYEYGRRLQTAAQALPDHDRRQLSAALTRLCELVHGESGVRAAAACEPSARSVAQCIGQETGLSPTHLIERLGRLATATERYLGARDRLFQANLRLVIHIARQFPDNGVDLSDRIQEGNIGLLRAVDKFDARFGFRFSTYSTYWIRLAISRAVNRQQRLVPLPHAQTARLSRISRAIRTVAQHEGCEPSFSTVAGHLQMDVSMLSQTLTTGQGIVSFDQGGQEETDQPSLYNMLAQSTFPSAADVIARKSLRSLLLQAIDSLDEREARIVGCHFGLTQPKEQTLQDLGRELNISRERARQIKVQALERLRKRFGDVLAPFLDQS